MVWGAIRQDGSRLLIKCNSRVDSDEYVRVLGVALPVVYSSRHILQHDGAPCHQSCQTTVYLTSKCICMLSDWPAQSPDLNLIENLWEILKENVRKRNPNTLNELWSVAEEGWNAIPTEVITKLYASSKKRFNEVISAKGRYTKY